MNQYTTYPKAKSFDFEILFEMPVLWLKDKLLPKILPESIA